MPNNLFESSDTVLKERIEAALEEARARGRRVIDAAPIAIAVLTGDELRFQYANPVYRSLRPDEDRFVGRTYRELFPSPRTDAESRILEVMHSGEPWKIRDFRADMGSRGTTWWEGECLALESDHGERDSVLILAWEVTGRHLAEDALRESEERFRDVFENAGVSVWIEDYTAVKAELDRLKAAGVSDIQRYMDENPDFVSRAISMVRVVDVNRESLSLFGATDKGQLTRALARVFTPSMERLFADDLVALAEGRPSVNTEASLRTLDGRDIQTLFTIRFPHDTGRYEHVVVTLVDITERRRAEAALRESEERFRLMADSAPVFIWMSGTDGGFTWVNRPWTEFTGRKVESELGLAWMENVHPDDLYHARNLYDGAIARRDQFEMEYRLRRSDGIYRWLVEYGLPRFDESGAFVGYIGSCIDITDRKLAEERLRTSEERYRAVVESQSEMLCRFRTDGTILFVNDAYARMQGTDPESLVGTNFWKLIPEEDVAQVRSLLQRLTPENPTVNIENRFETAQGTRWTLWTNRALVFSASGRVLEAQSSGIDISERKQMEEELRRANHAKDEILGMVSHEFRTPLSTIVGNIDILERPNVPMEQRVRSLQDLREHSGRLRRLIENMLVLAGGEARLEPELEPLLMQRILPNFLTAEQRNDESRPIELRVDEGVPPVLGNRGYIEQIIANLLSNARKYGYGGTPIYVVVKPQGATVSVAVRNHGDPVSPGLMERFFEPFFRDESASSVDGVGLGLSVCQRLVEAMGGTVSASAHPDGGAVIEFALAIAAAHDEE